MPLDPDDRFHKVRRLPVEKLQGDPDLLGKVRRFREKQEAKASAALPLFQE
jgi:hypothetical protein